MLDSIKTLVSESVPTRPEIGESAESRLDPITGDWTIIAPSRDARPDELKVTAKRDLSVDCPFCKGRESETPAAVWIACSGDGDESAEIINDPSSDAEMDQSWSVRVVPNRYPAVQSLADNHAVVGSKRSDAGLFESRPVCGGHEVIIETPNHHDSMADLDIADAMLVFRAYQDRMRYWRNVDGIRYVSVFKNVGGKAGASLHHSHSQLVAVDLRPRHVQTIVERMQNHRAKTGCCLQCDLLRAEMKANQRIIAQTDSLIAYCPFASRQPMMVRITTKAHQASFEALSLGVIEELSRLVTRIVSWMQRLIPGVSYNFLLHTMPPRLPSGSDDACHWSLELFPRLTQMAGFEWSSQCMIHSVLPESAAKRYRSCAVAEDPRRVLKADVKPSTRS